MIKKITKAWRMLRCDSKFLKHKFFLISIDETHKHKLYKIKCYKCNDIEEVKSNELKAAQSAGMLLDKKQTAQLAEIIKRQAKEVNS